MNNAEYIKAIKDVIYLSYCAVIGKTPSNARVQAMDIKNVYQAAQNHMLTSICAMALESAGVYDDDFTQAKGKAIRKNAVLDIDREAITARLEAEGIWYMPLKGAILKDYYPAYGMRQMSDNDILFDGTRAEDVRDIMLSLGFTIDHFGHGHHDVYFKKPVSNFEMHKGLFLKTHNDMLHDYYENVKSILIKDDLNSYGYHFSNEDFYIYITAHEFKHYSQEGIGLRSVLDTYIFLTKYYDILDMEYIKAECAKLGMADFEEQSRSLALDLFGNKKLTDSDKELLKYIVFSGTYGTIENYVKVNVKKHGNSKLKYVLSRLFPDETLVMEVYPFFYKHKILLPLLPFYRLINGLIKKRKSLIAEFKLLLK